MDKTTQVFREVITQPFFAPPMASGMAASLPPQTFTVKAFSSGDMTLSIGPLDAKKFKVGDRVKVIVQRIGKRKRESPNAR